MTKFIENIRVVIGQYNGSAIFSPFPIWDDHRGESYWLHDYELKVLEDNSIHIPAKILREFAVKAGHLRSDGNFAIAVKTKRFGDKNHKLRFGGEIVRSKDAKIYLEKGKNNSFIPKSEVENYDKRLKVYDFKEGYTLEFPLEDDI